MAEEVVVEGLLRALELRDKSSAEHTLRVVSLTLELARSLGIEDGALTYIRWGAMLHDIGKLGIPESILFKPGPLTPEEWVIVRQHPIYAFQLLEPIEFLRPALDMPYAHHELWDGTGYPRGLKGDEIPLAARILAVVEVWDALRSDLPYRRAWEHEKAVQYVKDQSGRAFDPYIVERFLPLIA